MKLTLSELNKVTLLSLSENELLSNLKTLSRNFTLKRELIGEKTYSESGVSAYTSFYLPTNFPKFKFVLDCLPKEFREELKNSTFIDVGSGPGTYSLALLDYFEGNFSEEVMLVDSSELMLEQARKCLGHFFPAHKDVSFMKELKPFKTEGKKTLFFGNSLNEMGLQKGLQLIKKINPDFFFMIEPGTKEVFSWVLDLRKEMGRLGYSPLFPCGDLNLSCPLEKKQEDDWCHQVLHTQHDFEVERISQKVGLDRRTLPFISHVYRKPDPKGEKAKTAFRLIRVLKETKFSYVWEVCFLEEGLQTINIEILKKDLSKDEKKQMKKIDIGITVHLTKTKELDSDNWRVKLIKS